MRPAQRRQPAGRLVDRVAGPDRAHRHRQPAAGRLGEVRRGGGYQPDAESRSQVGELRVALVVERMAVVGEFDADPLAAEPVHQVGQRRRGRVRPASGKGLAHMAFAAAGQDVPVSARRLGERVKVVARLALFTTGQMRRGQLPGQPSISLRAAGQHQQVRPRRIGLLGSCHVAQRQLSAEHRPHVQFLGGLGEPHHPVEPVVIGQRDGPQIEAGGLLDEFLRCAGAVEEAVRRMRVQLGIRHRRTGAFDLQWLVDPALA